MNNYQDIIDYEYKGPNKRKRMPLSKRAGIFAPFSALTGYDESIEETGRETINKKELSEEIKKEINDKLIYINNKKEKSIVSIVYFEKDKCKDGGKYIKKEGYLKKIDEIRKEIIFKDKTIIKIEDLINIDYNL